MKSTLLACRPGVLATLFLLAAFTPPADAQEWRPAKNGPGNVSWLGEDDITVPADQSFRCEESVPVGNAAEAPAPRPTIHLPFLCFD